MFLVVNNDTVYYTTVARGLNSDNLVSQFELQSNYNLHFRINTLDKSMNFFITFYGLNNVEKPFTRIALALNNPRRFICY